MKLVMILFDIVVKRSSSVIYGVHTVREGSINGHIMELVQQRTVVDGAEKRMLGRSYPKRKHLVTEAAEASGEGEKSDEGASSRNVV